MGGVDATRLIRQEFPAARIIVLTTYDGDEDIYRALKAGALSPGFKAAYAGAATITDARRALISKRLIFFPPISESLFVDTSQRSTISLAGSQTSLPTYRRGLNHEIDIS